MDINLIKYMKFINKSQLLIFDLLIIFYGTIYGIWSLSVFQRHDRFVR